MASNKASIAVLIAVLIVLFVVLRSAPSSSGIVGHWKSEPGGPKVMFTFRNDGTFEQSQQEGKQTLLVKGSYVAGTGRMKQTIVSMTLDGKPVDATVKEKEMAYSVEKDALQLNVGNMTTEVFIRSDD